MKIGAQLYSLRTGCTTPEDLKTTLERVKNMGYDIAQASTICEIDPYLLRSYIDEYSLPILCTHRSLTEIAEKTAECIAFHKIIGCPCIGLGSMPTEMRGSFEGLKHFTELLAEPVKRIKDAGLTFAYHNHAFEFESWDGVIPYDYLLETTEFDYIHDVYWSTYAGKNPSYYIKLLGESGRMQNIHFKDMKTAPQGAICPCGEGIIDFSTLAKECKQYGIPNVYVEQDNAPDLGDPFAQMEASLKHLRSVFTKEGI